jgi:hypothetical protein
MLITKPTLAVTLLTLLILSLTTCKKDIAPEPCNDPLDPNCINYHPCNGVQPITADFDMWYYVPGLDLFIEQDSVFPPGTILFKAKLNNAAYLWLLGKDTERVQSDYRVFDNNPGQPNDTSIYGKYYNTLTVNKTPNKNCHPNDAAVATLTRSITIKRPSKLLTSGLFKVLFDGYADSNIISILTWHGGYNGSQLFDRESPSYRAFVGFKDTRSDTVGGSNNDWYLDKNIYLKGSGVSYPYDGIIRVNPLTFIIEGNYKITQFLPDGGQIPKQHRFKGRKL